MGTYRFRLFDRLGRLTSGKFVDLEDDGQAELHADQLVAEHGHDSVEVWDHHRCVCRIEKGQRLRDPASKGTEA